MDVWSETKTIFFYVTYFSSFKSELKGRVVYVCCQTFYKIKKREQIFSSFHYSGVHYYFRNHTKHINYVRFPCSRGNQKQYVILLLALCITLSLDIPKSSKSKTSSFRFLCTHREYKNRMFCNIFFLHVPKTKQTAKPFSVVFFFLLVTL